jgi:hypothetical protein
VDLLRRLLHFNPSKRLTVQQALAHPYLSAVRDEAEETVHGSRLRMDIETSPLVCRDEIRANVSGLTGHWTELVSLASACVCVCVTCVSACLAPLTSHRAPHTCTYCIACLYMPAHHQPACAQLKKEIGLYRR